MENEPFKCRTTKTGRRKGDMTKACEKDFFDLTWGRGEMADTTHMDRLAYFGFFFVQ